MKKINKNLPVVVLQALKDFISSLDSSKTTLYHIIDHDDFLLKMVDNDHTSGFYFNIEKYDQTNGLLLDFKPRNKQITSNYQVNAPIKEIGTYFAIWHNCLVAYEELEEFYKDSFLRNLEDQFLTDFDLQDETKNEPLSLRQIAFLEECLSKIEAEIGNYKNEIDIKNIDTISQETTYVKSQLGKQTKEWVAKKVSSIFAKITKESPGVLKSIFKEVGKEIMSQGVKFLLEHGDKLIS